jgi:hypothetical protein
MPTISDEQLEALTRLQEDEFRRHLADWLQQHEPSAGAPLRRTTLEQMVDTGIRRARRNGLTDLAAVAGFVVAMFTLCPNFDEHPYFHALLKDASLTERQRVQWIGLAPRQMRVEAAQRSDLGAWFND